MPRACSCPGCFATLCLDCQKHARYHTQFRAVFVMNCKTSATAHSVAAPQQSKQQKHQRPAGDEATADAAAGEQFFPVACEVCGTQVGVRDADEVYHFFNVLASTP